MAWPLQFATNKRKQSNQEQTSRVCIQIHLTGVVSMGSNPNAETNDEAPKDETTRSSSSELAELPNRILCSSTANPCVDKSLLDTYNAYLESKPVLTKALTAATVQGLGAALGSILSSSKRSETSSGSGSGQRRGPRIDWLEVFAFALHGGLLNGPIGHYWFEWLDKNGPKSKSKSMLLDQLCVQPPLLFVMFVFLDMTRAAVREIKPSCGRTLSNIGPTVVSSWRFWPFAVWATFKYLKKKHYTVALNLCSIAWTVYLSKGKK